MHNINAIKTLFIYIGDKSAFVINTMLVFFLIPEILAIMFKPSFP